MEENNKVIVFEKKEIILVLIFVLVLIITSFTLGIRLGRKLVLNEAGIEKQDMNKVNLISAAEEDALKILEEDSKLTDDEKLKKLMEESKSRLSEELEKFSIEDNSPSGPEKIISKEITPSQVTTASQETAPKSQMTGKFTIQLGSYNNIEEAKQFAEGFTVRGYSPIINEVSLPEKGTWFRVSLGLFDSVEEAKKYIKEEQSLFAGQEHVISEIK